MSKPTTRIMSRGVVGAGQVGGERLAGDQHVGAQAVLAGEFLGHHDRRGGAAGRRAGHQAGHHAVPDHRRRPSRPRSSRRCGTRRAGCSRRGGSPWRGSSRRSRAWCRTSPCARGRRRRTGGSRAEARYGRPVRRPPSSARSSAGARSFQRDVSAPGLICSKPTASAQSTAPLCTAWRARNSADEPVAQLLLTLMTGMPVMPTW